MEEHQQQQMKKKDTEKKEHSGLCDLLSLLLLSVTTDWSLEAHNLNVNIFEH